MLRHLVASHGKTKNNVEFRRNLCLAGFASRLSLLVPIFVLWAWGLSAIITVNPPAVGFLLCFVGTSYAIGWFGFNHWR